MKLKIKMSVLLITILLVVMNTINAVSFGLTASKTSAEVGEALTLTISGPDVIGKVNITSSNPNVVTALNNQTWLEDSSSNIALTAKSAGTAIITVSGLIADVAGTEENSYTKTITITVKEKPAPPVVEPPTNNNNNNNNQNTKSSDNYLKTLNVNTEGLSPDFSKYKNNYTLTVGNEVDKLNLGYTVSHSKAKVSVTGNSNFVIGNNTVKLTVTAENGNKRTYTILVTKADDPLKADAFLENLVVENITFENGFEKEKLEYDLGELNISKLNILAYPKAEGAKVEIIGNEELKDGENIVKIKVTAIDGVTTKEYILKFNNKLPKKEDEVIIYDKLVDENNNNDKVNDLKDNKFVKWFSVNGLYLLLLLCMFLEFGQIIYLYNKLNKKENSENNNDKEINNEKIIEKVEKETEEKTNDNDNNVLTKENKKELTFEDLKPTGDVLEKINKEKEEISNIENSEAEEKIETLESILKKRRNKN